MPLFGKKLLKWPVNNWISHWCPGCRNPHTIAIDPPFSNGAKWTFNGNAERPSFEPSINCVGYCHYFLRDGVIQFLPDCKHALAGQTVPLPDYPPDMIGIVDDED